MVAEPRPQVIGGVVSQFVQDGQGEVPRVHRLGGLAGGVERVTEAEQDFDLVIAEEER